MFPHDDDDLQPFGAPQADQPTLEPEPPQPPASVALDEPAQAAPLGSWDDAPDVGAAPSGDGWAADPLAESGRGVDVLEPETDGRNEPVRIDRRFVMAGLLIAGTVLCLILVVFGGGGGPAQAEPGAPAASPPPGAYVDEATAGYYDEGVLDPAAPVEPAYPDPYGADPYAAQAYGGGYGSSAPVHGYATTQAYGPAETGQGGRTSSGAPARAVDPARESYERAVASPLMAGSAAAQAPAQRPPDDLGPEAAEELAFMREVAGMFSSDTGGSPSAQAPDAVRPTALASRGTGATVRSGVASQAPPVPSAGRSSAYEVVARSAARRPTLRAGSVIPAALVTGMNSDLPGPVVAQVTRNVYDSATQRDVLVPAGTRLVGEYDNQIATGQNRALVAWTQMVFPDGTTVELPGLPGADLEGYAGLSDRVDRHYGRVVGSALLLAAVGAGVEMAAPNRRGIGFDVSPQEVASRQVAIELSRIATETVRQDLRVQPTVRVSPGYRFYVLLARDLPFDGPYRARAAVGRFARGASPR